MKVSEFGRVSWFKAVRDGVGSTTEIRDTGATCRRPSRAALKSAPQILAAMPNAGRSGGLTSVVPLCASRETDHAGVPTGLPDGHMPFAIPKAEPAGFRPDGWPRSLHAAVMPMQVSSRAAIPLEPARGNSEFLVIQGAEVIAVAEAASVGHLGDVGVGGE